MSEQSASQKGFLSVKLFSRVPEFTAKITWQATIWIIEWFQINCEMSRRHLDRMSEGRTPKHILTYAQKGERCRTSEEVMERDMRSEQVEGLGHEVKKKMYHAETDALD